MENNFSYNRDALDNAIIESRKLTSIINNSLAHKYSNIASSIPSSFNGASVSALMNVVNGLSCSDASTDRMLYIEEFLKSVKNELDKDYEIQLLSNGLSGKYTFTEIDGQQGYLYIPNAGTAGMPIVTFLNGVGERGRNSVNSKGLSKALNEGLQMDAVVWVPISDKRWENNSAMDQTVNSINNLVNTYDLNPNKNVLIGYSSGGYGGFEYISRNPNYFSAFVALGAAPQDKPQEWIDNVANSDTEIIMLGGRADSSYGGINGKSGQFYNDIREAGGNIMCYQVDGVNHDYDHINMLSNELMSDVLNMEKGRDYITPANSGIIQVESRSILEESSIARSVRNENSTIAAYYKKLVPTGYSSNSNEIRL